ncbi:MAG TPA: hypothetical protein VIO33_26210, partial [Burkholderiaceae bacterium]
MRETVGARSPFTDCVRVGRRLVVVVALAAAGQIALAQPSPPSTTQIDELIQSLESRGRAHPNQAAAELEALRPSTPEFSPQRLELLTVQGLVLAEAWQGEAAERVAAQLDAWASSRQANAPAAVAALIRA